LNRLQSGKCFGRYGAIAAANIGRRLIQEACLDEQFTCLDKVAIGLGCFRAFQCVGRRFGDRLGIGTERLNGSADGRGNFLQLLRGFLTIAS